MLNFNGSEQILCIAACINITVCKFFVLKTKNIVQSLKELRIFSELIIVI